MRLHDLKATPGARQDRRRVGRGIGSGMGKTATKGSKGQLARSGGGKGPAFEGGQMPLQRRLPKRGFTNIVKKEWAVFNVEDLERFDAGTVVTPELLRKAGVIKDTKDGVKILGRGEITKALTVQVQGASKTAVEKVAAAGGKVEVV